MRRIDAWLRASTRLLAVAGMIALFGNAFAVALDAFLRSAFAAPIDRLSDVSGMIFVIAAACCVPAATANRAHITIRALEGRLGPRARAAIETFAALLSTLVFALVTWQLVVYVGEVSASGQTLSQIEIPIAPLWIFVTACIGLATACQAVACLDQALVAVGRGSSLSGGPLPGAAPADRETGMA
jgi:TRAP-type C4-dicarboxylate transport system permease small subunit